MADKVPYTGAPDTPNLRLEPTPQIHVDAPAAAFGANVGQAVENFGQVQEGAGKELFARALAFQDLTNNATARGAAVQTAHEQAALWGEFDSKGGMDAGPEALAKLHADLEAVRQKNGKDLNPTAAELYQREAASTQSHLYIYSATHSAQAVKKYDVDNINAGKETRHALVTGAANIDPSAAAASWAKDEKDAVDMGHHLGEAPDSPTVKARIIDNHNGTSLAAITGFIDRRDPDRAQKFLELAQKNGKITGEAVDKAVKMIADSQDRIGAAKTAAEAEAAGGTPEEKLARAKEINDKKTGGDPVAASRAQSIIMTNDAVKQNLDKQALNKANSAIDEVIANNVGKAPLSIDDLRHNPDLKEAFGVIDSDNQRSGQTDLALLARIRSTANGDGSLTPERLARTHELIGMAHDPAQIEAFLKVNLWNENISANQRQELRKIQDGLLTGGSQGFHDRALEATMAKNKDLIKDAIGKQGSPEYNEFRGVVQAEFDYYREKGKVVMPEMADDLVKKMVQEKVLKTRLDGWWDTKGKAYQPDEAEAAKIRNDLGAHLTDEQVQKAYLKKLNDKLYGKPDFTKPAAKAAAPPAAAPATLPPASTPAPTLPEPATLLPRVESYDR